MGENGDLVWGTNNAKPDDNWFNIIYTQTNKDMMDAKLWEIDGIDKTN